ncbi:MAG: SpoIIIAH-like family protein [Clostridia bacterium]|nr:SpoIIIAH-like family protein [Clostridia bacterium]
MNVIIKRRQLILATLVVALGAAVFVNWYYTGSNSLESTAETTNPQYVQNLGEAKYVNADSNSSKNTNGNAVTGTSDYFSTVKLNRQKSKDEALEKLNKSLSSAKTGSDEAKAITESINNLTQRVKAESDIEALISAKISGECVVVLNEDSAQVIVKKGALNSETALQIMDIVTTNSKLSAEKVKISESQ